MNHIHRLVWNAQTGSWVAVAETARSRGKGGARSARKAFFAALIASGFAMAPALAELPATTVVPASGKTNAYISANGVPVVNIDTANGKGLSHNFYTQYNVEANGLVLNNGNNSQIARQSQLAGQVVANLNLVQEAKVILNEVVSTNRSALAGFTEVLGGKADVIVANPNGISCNGCGFINTDRVTLTTGTSNVAGDGSLTGFSVNRGDVLIEGLGANASTQQIFDIVARSVKLDGKINVPATNSLGITTGNNIWSYDGRNVTGSVAGSGVAPAYAFDSTVLGGMYAGRIHIIATEAGVGVRMLGEAAASADDFTLSSAGKVDIRGKVSAERDLALTYTGTASNAAALDLNGPGAELAAKRDVTLVAQNAAGTTLSDGKITAGQDLTLSAGSLTDSSSAAATRFAARNTTVTTSGAVSIDRPTWGAGGKLAMTMSSLTVGANKALLYSGADANAANRNLELVTTGGDLALNGISLLAGGNLTLGGAHTANFAMGAGGSLKAGGSLSISANNAISNAGEWLAGGNLLIEAADGQANLTNSGTIQAGGNLTLGEVSHLLDISNQSGAAMLGDTLGVRAGSISNAGTLQATNGASVNAVSFSNVGSTSKFLASTASGADGSLNMSGAFNNQGILQSAGALTVAAGGALSNSGSVLTLHAPDGSNGALALNGLTVDNSGTLDSGGTLNVTVTSTVLSGDTFLNAGAVQSAGAMTLTVGNRLWNKSTGKIITDASVTVTSGNAAFAFSNDGLLQSTGNMALGQAGHLAALNNAAYNAGAGLIRSDASLSFVGGAISNAGTIQAASGATVSGSTFTNTGTGSQFLVSTTAGADGSLSFTGAVDNQGTMQSAGGFSVTTNSTLVNSGTIKAAGSSDTLALSATTLTNSGNIEGGDVTTLTASNTSGTTLSNSGQVHSVHALSMVSGGDISNTSSGKLLGDTALAISTGQSSFVLSNAGLVQSGTGMTLGGSGHVMALTNASSGTLLSGGTLAFTGGAISNAGTIQAASGATVSGSTFTNTGTGSQFLVSTTAGADGVLSFTGALDNQGTMQSAGGFSVTTNSTLVNSGTIKAAGSSDTLALSATTLTNSGNIEGGDVTTLTATNTSGTTVSNSGQVHSVHALSMVSGGDISNTSSGKLLGDTALAITTGQSSFVLSNAGLVQSGTGMTLGGSGHVMALTNASSGTLFSGGTLAFTGGAISNAGTIQAASGATVSGSTFTNTGTGSQFLVSTTAGADGSLSFTGAVDNQGTLQSAGGLSVTTSSTLVNSGTIKAAGSSDTLALSATTLTNSGNIEGGDVTTLTATNTSGTTLSNSGQVHSVHALSMVSGGDISNTSSGNLLSDASLTIVDSPLLINDGLIQTGTGITLGSSTYRMALNNQTGGVIFAGEALALQGSTLDNQGRIYATTGVDMNVSSMTNGSSTNNTALILGAMNTGASAIDVSGALNNYGAIHSNDTLSVQAAGIFNRSGGGISSLNALNLTATGTSDIDNYGALYAEVALNLTATNGSIYNRTTTGTIDSSGTLTTSSTNFTNNSAVVAAGNIDITTSNSFVNETVLASGASIGKSLGGATNQGTYALVQNLLTEGSLYQGADINVYGWTFDRTEALTGTTTAAELHAMTKAQIIGNGGATSTLNIHYGNTGKNYLAVISAPNVTIGGTPGVGIFTNEDLALYRISYSTQVIEVHDDYVGAGTGKKLYEFWGRDASNANASTNVDGSHDEWGQYDAGPGWSRFNHGNNSETWASAGSALTAAKTRSEDSGAAMSTAVTVDSFGAGIFGTTINFTSGTLANVGSPWPNDVTKAKATTVAPPGTVKPKTQSNGTSTNANNVTGATGSGMTGANAVNGAVGSNLSGANAVNAINGTSASSKTPAAAGAKLNFAGLNLTLPSSPNGYYVASTDPNAHYLVETNPLFAVKSNYVGSDYMANRYGYNPDTIIKNLGDSNYEAFLIRQQLIQQTGSNLLNGYGTEAAQMKRLMDQAVEEGQSAGFIYGQALTTSQVQNLKQDIVWMEAVVVAGQTVLAPHVYLAQSARDMIVSGAVIAGTNVSIAGDALSNTGGTIQGSGTLNVKVTGDITNTSGNMEGGNVSLMSTEGSIINQTQAEGAGNATTYDTAVGKTAGITSTGTMELVAEKDIRIVGATVQADGGLDMLAGGTVDITEVVVKKISSTSNTTVDAKNVLVPDDTTTTNSTKTTEKGQGSTITAGTPEQRQALEAARADLQKQGEKTSAARQEIVDINASISKDPSSIARAEVTAKIKAALKADADALLALLNLISPPPPAQVEMAPIPPRTTKEELAYRKLTDTQKAEADAAREKPYKDAQIAAQKVIDDAAASKELSPEAALAMKKDYNSKLAAYKAKEKELSDANPLPDKSEAVLKLEAERQVKTETYKTLSNQESVLQDKLDEAVGATGGLKVAATSVTIKGSAISVAGNAKFNVDEDINILSGTDKASETTTTVKQAYFTTAGEGDQEKLGKEAPSSKSEAQTGRQSASASADAKAEVGHESNLEFASTQTTTNTKTSSKNVASTLDIGGNLDMTAGNKLKVQGADIKALGDVLLDAKNIEILAGVNTETESTTTSKVGVGIYNEDNASAEAQAKAKATGQTANAKSDASAEASADHTSTIGLQTTTTTDDYSKKTSTAVTLSGNNVKIKAKETVTFQGANVDAKGDLDIAAKDITSLAAVDEETRKTSSSVNTVGVYIGSEAKAEAGAEVKASPLGGGAEVSAEAKAEVSAGLREANKSETTDSGSKTNVVNTFKVGGNLTRKAENTITDEGTQLEAGGNIEQSATRLVEKAISDSVWDNKTSGSVDARAGVSAQVGAEASADAKAGVTGAGAGANAGVEASAGAKASVKVEGESETKQSTTAVTSKYKAGGKISSTTTEETVLVGTQFEAGGDIELNAKSLDYKAAKNTSTESKSSSETEAMAKVKLVGTAGGEGEASYAQDKANKTDTTAVVGTMNSTGGSIKIKTKEDTTLEGTNISAEKNVSIASEKGSVNFKAAEDTKTEAEAGFSVAANLKVGAGGAEAGASGGYNERDFAETKKQAVNIKSNSGDVTIAAEKTVTMEGTKIASANDTRITANEVLLLEAKDVTKESGGGFQANANASSSSQSMGVDVSVKTDDKQTGNASSIATGGKLTIDAKKIVSQEAEYDKKKTTTSVAVEDTKKTNIDKGLDLEFSVDAAKDSSDSKKQKDADKSSTQADSDKKSAVAKKDAAEADAKKATTDKEKTAANNKKEAATKDIATADKKKADAEKTKKDLSDKATAETKEKTKSAQELSEAKALVNDPDRGINEKAAAQNKLAAAVALNTTADKKLAEAEKQTDVANTKSAEAKSKMQEAEKKYANATTRKEKIEALTQKKEALTLKKAADALQTKAKKQKADANQQKSDANKNQEDANEQLKNANQKLADEPEARTKANKTITEAAKVATDEKLKKEIGEKIKTKVGDTVDQAEKLEPLQLDELKQEVNKKLSPD